MKYMYWILDLIQTICNILKSHLVAYSVLTVASYIVIATDDDFFLQQNSVIEQVYVYMLSMQVSGYAVTVILCSLNG